MFRSFKHKKRKVSIVLRVLPACLHVYKNLNQEPAFFPGLSGGRPAHKEGQNEEENK